MDRLSHAAFNRVNEATGQRGLGARAAMHQHPREQIFWMLSGGMDFDLAGEKRTCMAGDLGVIPSNTPHEVYFPEDAEVIDMFAPPREDMFTGGDTYVTREQAVEKGPDARRRPKAGREAYSMYVARPVEGARFILPKCG